MDIEGILSTPVSRREILLHAGRGITSLALSLAAWRVFAERRDKQHAPVLPDPLGGSALDLELGVGVIAIPLTGEVVVYRQASGHVEPFPRPLPYGWLLHTGEPLRSMRIETVQHVSGPDFPVSYEIHPWEWDEASFRLYAFLEDDTPFWQTSVRLDTLTLRVNDQPFTLGVYFFSQPIYGIPRFLPYPVVHYQAEDEQVRFTAYYHQHFINTAGSFLDWKLRDLLPPATDTPPRMREVNTLFNVYQRKACLEEKLSACDPLTELSRVGISSVPRADGPFRISLPLVEAFVDAYTAFVKKRAPHARIVFSRPAWVLHPSYLERQPEGFLPYRVRGKKPYPLEEGFSYQALIDDVVTLS